MTRVTLVWHTPQPERMVALAMRRCYSTKPIEELERELDEKGEEYVHHLVRKALQDKTFDVIEHVVFMFEVEGISRVCSHQLVRHRIASYDQESQRFAAAHREEMVMPPSFESSAEAERIFHEAVDSSLERYRRLTELGVPKEDARFILPQCIATKLVVTMNARSLMHFLWQRTAQQAQWEIRRLAQLMHEEARRAAPVLFEEITEC